MMKIKLLLLFILSSLMIPLFGQISAGGFPLEITSLKTKTLKDNTVRMPSFDVEKEKKESEATRDEKSEKFAHSFNVDLSPGNSGEWFTTKNYRIWQLHISSENALSIGLIFTKYKVPDGARLFIFDPQKETIYGAFTSANNKSFQKLAIYPFPGDELIIQYEEPLDADFEGELELGRINHDYVGVILKNRWKQRPSGDCNVDVNCETSSGLEQQKRAVCRILADDELGTATLLNNTAGDGSPILISAFHVFDSIQNAEVTLFDFNYESPFCLDIDGYDVQSVSGAKALASFDSLDFILVQLSVNIPASYRPYYAGWDATGTVPSNSYVIHHPNGDVKKISHDEGTCDTLSFAGNFTKYGHWKVLNWETGTTEAGSSGASLFSNKRVFGTLSGGAASCDDLSYDAFARLNRMWNYKSGKEHQLKAWLDPLATGAKKLDGYDPFEAESKSCRLISNFLIEDQVTTFKDQVPDRIITEVAERFAQTESTSLAGIALGIKDYKTKSADPELTILVYSGTNVPEIAQKQYKFSMNKLTSHAMNYLDFGENLYLTGNFFISVEMDSRDSITFYQSNKRSISNSSSMLVKENGEWNYFSAYNTEGQGASVLMQVNICGGDFVQSIDTLGDSEYMKFYPNPARNYVVVEFLDRETSNELTIFDRTGRIMFNECYQSRNFTEIDVSGLQPGIYLLNIQTNNQSETKRLMVL